MSNLALIESLEVLARDLRGSRLGLDLSDATDARHTRDELAAQIDDYLLPRLTRIDAPLLAVLGGSTGAGKSTVTNSIVGADISPAGVLRPTTRAPVLVCNPADMEWFSEHHLLPDLPRVTGEKPASGAMLHLRPTEAIDPGLAFLDSPDIDSVEEANRELATQLLAAADLWIFTTTAARYADAVPWDFLRQAQSRGTALAVLLNRVPVGAGAEIGPHLDQMLVDAGLNDVTRFTIESTELTDGRLPDAAISEIRTWLHGLAADAEARAQVVRKTLQGALASVPDRAEVVLTELGTEAEVADDLWSAVRHNYDEAILDIRTGLDGGAMLRSEVLDRWQELVGTGEFMRGLQARVGRFRDGLRATISGKPTTTAEVEGEITASLETLILAHADSAALKTTQDWRASTAGSSVLNDDTFPGEPDVSPGGPARELERASTELRENIRKEIREWQDSILELVREQGESKRTMARVLSLGVNSVGMALMVVIFAQTGGVTGTEVAVGAGTAGLSQTLLAALFGEQAVRDLATEAKTQLSARIDQLLAEDANRFHERLWAVATPPAHADALASAIKKFKANA